VPPYRRIFTHILDSELQKIRQSDRDPRPDDFIHLYRGHRTVSANGNRLFINSLVDLELYDEYYEVALKLIAVGSFVQHPE
jgi:hypothetical protein